MTRLVWAIFALLASFPACALSPAAREFMEISREIESMQCEKRKLRREIAVAEAQQREADARALRADFDKLDKNPRTASLERRLSALQKRISDGKGGTRDPEDLDAISRQQREAFYRCG